MSGFSATDLGIVSPRLAALKRRAAAGRPVPLAPPPSAPSSIDADRVAGLTPGVAEHAADGTVFDPPRPPAAAPDAHRHAILPTRPLAGTRSHERRWRDASIIIVERRRGPLYKYASVAVCAALWAQVFWMFRT